MEELKFCHVCKKEKKAYTVLLNNDLFSYLCYESAREGGEICQRCDQYYAMTGELKESTKEEFKKAEEACKFAQMMFQWWTRDRQLDCGNNIMQWEGINEIAKWYREKAGK